MNNNPYLTRMQQQNQQQLDWKSQYPETSRVENVMKLFQQVFNSMSDTIRSQPGMQNNLRLKAQEYEQSQFNSCATRELYIMKINEQLLKIKNSKQQIGQMGQQSQQMGVGQQMNINNMPNTQQLNNMPAMGLNIQQPNSMNGGNRQIPGNNLMMNHGLGFSNDAQKAQQLMQLQQMSNFNSQLMSQLMQQNQQQQVLQMTTMQSQIQQPIQQQFAKPGSIPFSQPNNLGNFQFQNQPVAQKLPGKSPLLVPNVTQVQQVRQLAPPSIAEIMRKHPSRDAKIVNELLLLEASTSIPTQILDLPDATKKEITEVLNQLSAHFREIDQIIYDMKTVLNNEGGFPLEKMMIIKKLLDVQYDSLANVNPPYFIIDVNFCRQAVKQIHNLKSMIEKKKAAITIDIPPKPEAMRIKTPPKISDQTDQISIKSREILERDYGETLQTSMLAKYINTVDKKGATTRRNKELDMNDAAELLYGPCQLLPVTALLPMPSKSKEKVLDSENTLQSKLTILSSKYSTSFTLEKIANLFFSIIIFNAKVHLNLTTNKSGGYNVDDISGVDDSLAEKVEQAARNGATIEALFQQVFKAEPIS